jgi:hypothetical protein
MDVRDDAGWASGMKGARTMPRAKEALEAVAEQTDPETMRHCIGSARYGIEPHDAPQTEFPVQPSQPDGLGRMCSTHWSQYTRGLARDAKARKAAAEGATEGQADTPPETRAATPRRRTPQPVATPTAGAQGDAG